MFERIRPSVVAGLWLLAASPLQAEPLESLTDPMQPPVVPAAAPSAEDADRPPVAWRLQGIRIDQRRRSALVNGQTVTVGDDIDGARILNIENDRVVIQKGEEPATLRLLEHDVKRTSRGRR